MLDSPDFGTHKLTCFKHRHLGEEYMRALQPVRMDDDTTLSKNCVYLDFNNFNITEVGDLQDLVDTRRARANVSLSLSNDELPDI